ncbi:hypothetical protein OE766_28915 [Pararhizobium sp. YC-54]|uniref:RNase A-like domain-containing protein n=1 Tax=Pararhizobium sp. YC-54 TaxID=2986920 RepID=UPI0021F78367|nr:RNase A-like domain-containing protein [Pararhizobium sp. YC-54]MCW0002221.1 hypothetical protein [Pararhizobium sp. YC-54]
MDNTQTTLIYKLTQLRLMIAAATVQALLRKANFNPDQPRVPAGEPGGGRWTDDSGSTGGFDDTLTFISEIPPHRYTIDLRQHENYYGGHAIARHVGKTDAELLDRVNTPDVVIRLGWLGPVKELQVGGQAGTFLSLVDANDFVNLVLNNPANNWLVQKLEGGDFTELKLFQRFGYRTGKEAFRSTKHSSAYIRPTYAVYVLLRPDPQKQGKFRIVTAYPTNELPGRKN